MLCALLASSAAVPDNQDDFRDTTQKDPLIGLSVVKELASQGIVDGIIASRDPEDGLYRVVLNTQNKDALDLTKDEVLKRPSTARGRTERRGRA